LRRTVSAVQSLKSTNEQRHCCHLLGSSHVTPGTATNCRRWIILGHHCSMLARNAQAEAYSSGFQVMLTMVSIDATDGVNEELSRSLSLAKEIPQVESWSAKGACAKSRVRGLAGSPLA
jgi:hypothetical protein